MTRRMIVLGLIAGSVVAAAGFAQAVDPEKSVERSIGPDRMPRAAVSIAAYRSGDLLWENDRTAHRIYGHALEAIEPPSGSGVDAWGKGVRWPYMDRQLRKAAQHEDTGEGVDFYHVGQSRGAGGLGIWHDNKLWTSRNYVKARILKDGPTVAQFEVDYAPWPVDVARKVWETRRFTLPMGTNFTRMISTIRSDRSGPLVVGIGIARRAVFGGGPPGPARDAGQLTVDRKKGLLSFWSASSAREGSMAVALLVDPASIVDIKDDADNHLVLLRVTPGKPFVYYMGAAWEKGQDFRSRSQWDDYVRAQRPNFDPAAVLAGVQ